MKIFASWSGGKDRALATCKVIKQGHEVRYLLNFISEDGAACRAHGIPPDVIALQAEAMGIRLLQVRTSWDNYEENFKRTVRDLKEQGIEGGVFGDMDIAEHRAWIERVCAETGITPLLPLWQVEPAKLMDEFLKLGFKALVVATRLDKKLLGRVLDTKLLGEIKELGSHICGENGEYHSYVTDGPIFMRALNIIPKEIIEKDGSSLLNITAELLPDKSDNLSR